MHRKRAAAPRRGATLTQPTQPAVGDATLGVLAQRCPELEQLGLAYCNRITDAGAASLIAARPPRLERLNLRGVDGVTQAALAALQVALPHCAVLFDKG